MPLIYKIPAYAGNLLMLLLSVVMLFDTHPGVGLVIGALTALNLFLVYKLDAFSRPEAWLAHQLEMTKLQEALLESQKHVEILKAGAKADPPP